MGITIQISNFILSPSLKISGETEGLGLKTLAD